MSKTLVLAGVVMSILGVALIPLPGPGFPVLIPGLLLLVAGIATRRTSNQDPAKPS